MAGIGTRKVKIEVDGTEYTAEMSNARFTSGAGDTDFLTFADAAAGGNREYRFQGTAVQDAAAGSLWRQIWDNAGDEVTVTLMPYGNAAPSITEPHFEGTAVIAEPDGDYLGGAANVSSTARMTVDISWELTGKPTMITT